MNIILSAIFACVLFVWQPQSAAQEHGQWTRKSITKFNAKGSAEVAFSTDGSKLVATVLNTKPVLIDVKSGRKLREFGANDQTFSGADFSPSGQHVVSSSVDEWNTNVWSCETGAIVRKFDGAFVSYLDEGRIVVTSKGQLGRGSGPARSSRHYWHAETGVELKIYPSQDAFESSSREVESQTNNTIDHAGIRVSNKSDRKKIDLVDLKNGDAVRSFDDVPFVVTRTKRSPHDPTMSGRFEYSTGKLTIKKDGLSVAQFGEKVNSFHFSPTEYLVATLSAGDRSQWHEISIWNPLTGNLQQNLNSEGRFGLVDFEWSADGTHFAAIDRGGNLHLYWRE